MFKRAFQRPKKLTKQKLNDTLEQLVQSLRLTYNFGPQRIHIHLLRVHHIDLSSATIWRVLKKHKIPAIKKYRKHQDYTRYSRPVPGDRVQFDVTKVGAKCY